jgi:putative ABC transport system permease protein
MNALLLDIRYAFRQLCKSPGFACATVLSLTLGIGGVTALFSTLYTVMIRPLPYPAPDRLVLGRATYGGGINPWLSGPDYVDYRDNSRSFAALEAFFCFPQDVTAVSGQTVDRASALIVSTGLFRTLGVKMASGRPFTAEEGRDKAPPVALVSSAYWREHLGGSNDVIGRSLAIDGVSYQVVGVTPPDFHFIYDADVWLPLRPQALGPRRFNNWFILGRLADNVTLSEAQSDVDVIAARLERSYPDTNAKKALLLTPLQGAFSEPYRPRFLLLSGGALAILLIACANAAGLLLARGAMRQGEFAVRAAMGSSRWRLMRPLLAEALILAAVAGVAGTLLARWIQSALLSLMPVETLLLGAVGLSRPVLLFVLLTTILTGFGFGLLPALRARRADVAQDLRASGRGMTQQGVRLRRGLVVGQVALSFLLLIVAGLFIRTLNCLRGDDPGFDYRNLLTVEAPLSPVAYPDERRAVFFSSLLEEVRALPGVRSAAAISQLPIRNPYNNIDIYATDNRPTTIYTFTGNQRVVLPGYFKAMGIPLLSGRDIQPTDTPKSGRVVVISRSLAETLFPKRNPLGGRVIIDRDEKVAWEVVGVVGDVKENGLDQSKGSRGTFYRAYGQLTPPTMGLAIRTAGDPLAAVASLRRVVQKMDSQVPLSGPRTMEAVMANSTVSQKAQAIYLTTFSLLALSLAAVGIYGLLAYIVTQRRCDIGVRMALGAAPAAILRMIVHSGMRLVGIGLAAGIVGAFAVTHLLSSLLFGVTPTDALTFGGVAALLSIVAGVACSIPAWRASKVDPIEALHYE